MTSVGATTMAVATAMAMATVTAATVTAATKTATATVAAGTATAAKKLQTTKSCSEKSGNNGGSRGVSGGRDGFDVCSGNNDSSGNSNGNSAVTEAMTTAIATVAVATVTVETPIPLTLSTKPVLRVPPYDTQKVMWKDALFPLPVVQ